MLLLLLMYLAPFVAMALYWYAQRGAADWTGWSTLQAVAVGRSAYVRPASGALLFAAVVIAGSVGMRGGVAFLAGAGLTVFAAALAYSASSAALERTASRPQPRATNVVWRESSAIALAPAAVATGCIGALAWFFADPAGAVVLAAFATGSSVGALFLSMTLGTVGATRVDNGSPGVASARIAITSAMSAAMHSHLPAVAAALMVASAADPEMLLPLGGLLVETETLRSELLLLPIAISILSPLLALLAAPPVSALLERRGTMSPFDVDRLSAVLACLAMLTVVMASGLAWVVAAAFATGVAARQLAVVADEASIRAERRETPSLLPALLSAAALACGEFLAGWYGITLAALGMTATFASAAACGAARVLTTLSNTTAAPAFREEFATTEATVTLTTTLALLVAMAPVLVAEAAHRGTVVTMVVTAAPALLLVAVVGAAAASILSARYAEIDERDAVSKASRAVALATGAPALAGILLGAGAAVGFVLGFMAWAAALADGLGDPASSPDRMPRSTMLAWGRTMAIAALVGVPMMR